MRRMISSKAQKYIKDLATNHPDPSAEWGGASYTAGTGIDITNNEISANIKAGSGIVVDTDLTDDSLVVMIDQEDIPYKSDLATVATTGDYDDLTNKPTIPDAVSGTNDGTNWTSLTIGQDTYDIPQGGGSSYTFTNGLTESSGTVSWDLNDRIGADTSSYSLKLNEPTLNEASYDGLAIGTRTTSGDYSFAGGYSAQKGSFSDSQYTYKGIVSGTNTTATHKGSFAFGHTWKGGTIRATNAGSIALGYAETTLDSSYGYGIFSSGLGSMAIGRTSGVGKIEATGNGSVAIGSTSSTLTKISSTGTSTIAIGAGCSASGTSTIASGLGCTASGNNGQIVIGTFNISDTTSSLIIGNGTSTSARSNAMTVDTSGNMVLAGSITATNIPASPTTQGTYKLRCTVDANGVPTYTWEADV